MFRKQANPVSAREEKSNTNLLTFCLLALKYIAVFGVIIAIKSYNRHTYKSRFMQIQPWEATAAPILTPPLPNTD